MRTALDFLFFLIAAILFGLSIFPGVPAKFNLMAAGLLAFTLPFLITAWPGG